MKNLGFKKVKMCVKMRNKTDAFFSSQENVNILKKM